MDVFARLDLAVPATLLCIIVALLYLYGIWTHSTWSSAGIPGPKPAPFLGNIKEFSEKGVFQCLRQWSKQYGKVFGMYLMRQPVLMTTDLDIVKEILVKDFANFSDRNTRIFLRPYPSDQGLSGVEGAQWKRQRHTLTPTFSASKLKAMGGFITRCCHNLSTAIRKNTEAGKLLDVKHVYGSYTLDVICGTAFGFETNALGHEDNIFLKNVKRVFDELRPFNSAGVIGALFPFTIPLLKLLGCSSMPKKEVRFITETIRSVIEDRKKTGGSR